MKSQVQEFKPLSTKPVEDAMRGLLAAFSLPTKEEISTGLQPQLQKAIEKIEENLQILKSQAETCDIDEIGSALNQIERAMEKVRYFLRPTIE